MNKKKLNEDFDIISEEELKQANDISTALALINSENVISEINPIEQKKFIVEKNKDLLQSKSKLSLEEKNDLELDEIANQADQAFFDLMNIAINNPHGRSCAELATTAQSFLTIKLNSRIAKAEAKFKKLNYDLQLKKFEASLHKNNDTSDENENNNDDDIIIIEN